MFEGRNHQNTTRNEEEKSALSPRWCTMSQVDQNNSKTIWFALWIASAPTLFSRYRPQRLQAVCRPQKNTPEKEIWLQWRSDIRNWGVFWGQRQIVLQKGIELLEKHCNQYHHRRRLCCWIKSNFTKNFVVL